MILQKIKKISWDKQQDPIFSLLFSTGWTGWDSLDHILTHGYDSEQDVAGETRWGTWVNFTGSKFRESESSTLRESLGQGGAHESTLQGQSLESKSHLHWERALDKDNSFFLKRSSCTRSGPLLQLKHRDKLKHNQTWNIIAARATEGGHTIVRKNSSWGGTCLAK